MIPVLVLIAAVGACIGSFLNVCIWRLPREESIISPGSHCVRCGRGIAWYDNTPVLSYLCLGGRCRRCKAPISWRYPLIELLASALAVGLALRFGLTARWAIYTVLAWALIVSTFVDFSHRIIPDEITKPGIAIGLVASAVWPSLHGAASPLAGLGHSALGALVGGGSLYLTGVFGDWLFKKESMGGGDVKLLAMAGTVLGAKLVLLTFFLAPLLAVGPGLLSVMRKGDHTIPYGPFLSLGLLMAMVWGSAILHAFQIDDTCAALGYMIRDAIRR